MGLDGKHRALVIRAGSEHGSGDVGARDVRARRRRRRIATGLAALASAILTAAPASACRLALVLAIDVSSSVDAAEDRLQRQGLAAALRDADVAAAIARARAQLDGPLSARSGPTAAQHGAQHGTRGAHTARAHPLAGAVNSPSSGGGSPLMVSLPTPGGSSGARAAARGNVPRTAARPLSGGHLRGGGATYYHLFS